MKRIAALVLSVGCTSPESDTGIYQVAARNFDPGSVLCTAPGEPTPPAVPDFQLTMNDHGQLAYAWCDSPTECDPLGALDYFDPNGDSWRRATALVVNAPDEGGQVCSLGLDTLAIHRSGDTVHVDLLRKDASDEVAACTPARAIAKLESDTFCSIVDRYDLVPLP
jgi:hypothetical protein